MVQVKNSPAGFMKLWPSTPYIYCKLFEAFTFVRKSTSPFQHMFANGMSKILHIWKWVSGCQLTLYIKCCVYVVCIMVFNCYGFLFIIISFFRFFSSSVYDFGCLIFVKNIWWVENLFAVLLFALVISKFIHQYQVLFTNYQNYKI